MIRIWIVVEGQTEETFVKKVLYEYFYKKNIFLTPILLEGASTYGKIKKLVRTCLRDSQAHITTMLDYYALPKDFPGKGSIPSTDIFSKALHLEQQFSMDIGQPHFIPNLIIHEFEGLLFSDVDSFSELIDVEPNAVAELKQECKKFSSPEHINDNSLSAPSKRIKKYFPRYQKVFHGTLIASHIGLDIIREKCKHFDKWLQKMEALRK